VTKPRIDVPILCALLFLVGVGLVMVYSSSSVLAAKDLGDEAYYLKRQLAFAAAGLVAFGVGAAIDPLRFEKHAYGILVGAIVLLVLVLVPGIGHVAGGARRWFTLGPISLQAGEPIKLALVVYLAMSLAKKGERMRSFSVGVLPHFLIPGVAMVLLLGEPDFGTAVMLATITFLMLFVGGARVGYLAGAFLVALPVALHVVASSPYRMRRVDAFLDPWSHRSDIGYQITESLMTLGSGGFLGLGVGDGRQKLFFLPAAHTDFIFAVSGEELGFIGVTGIIAAFGVIAVRGVSAALTHEKPFLGYFALGLTALLVIQALFNIAVVLGLVPTKGITLPFVSYGGSSLVMSLFMAGILARVTADAGHAGLPTRTSSTPPRARGSAS
jgi:cell division protein FtsW